MLKRLLGFIPLYLVPLLAMGGVQITDIRTSTVDGASRVVFEMTGPAIHKVFTLEAPHRVVIDLKEATLATSTSALEYPIGPISRIRSGMRVDGLRVVIDLASSVQPASFSLAPTDGAGHRLVVDLKGKQTAEPKITKTITAPVAEKPRDIVIAIDAGHGGKDPGAMGSRGTQEKDVVLAVARKLAAAVNQERGMRAVLIRDDDRFISLRQRTQIARSHNADLLISIHADAFRNGYAKGSSVFILSERGASSEAAKWLAANENAADLVGGISLDDKDEMLRSVLLDLSQTASIEASMAVAEQVLRQLKRVGKVHKPRVEQAGFVVLKSPDIPSILVELAFISNPTEEKRLRDANHQSKMASSVFRGIRDYFRVNPPPGTLLAQREQRHIIARGETLSEIAQRYQVNLENLKVANALSDDRIRVGQVLYIPTGSDS